MKQKNPDTYFLVCFLGGYFFLYEAWYFHGFGASVSIITYAYETLEIHGREFLDIHRLPSNAMYMLEAESQ